METTGSPTFLGNPHCALALLFDPGRTNASGHAMRRRGPRCVHDEGFRIRTFEAQSHGFGTGCLRFAGRVAPTPRKTRFRLLAKLFRTGLITRRVPSKGFKVYPTSILLSQVQRSARTSTTVGRRRTATLWRAWPRRTARRGRTTRPRERRRQRIRCWPRPRRGSIRSRRPLAAATG